jgi:HK97 family phage major capsid protein
MALKTIMLRKSIDKKKEELEALRQKDAEFQTREAELEAAIGEAQTDEEQAAVSEQVEAYDTEHNAHEAAKDGLTREIEALENELAEEERKQKVPAPAAGTKPEERRDNVTMTKINIRSLPQSQRAFEALPVEQRNSILAQEDVKNFLSQLRSMKGQTRAISGGELTIPVVFLDLIAENMFRYSKLMNRVRIREVSGQARQTIAGTVPEAVWTEMCGNLNELTFQFNQVTLDGYKVGGFVPVCNALLEDNDVNLASWIIEMMSESIGLAKDKAILYGKGSAYHMPLGIVTRLAQQSQPASYPANAPAWVDLHSTNIITLASNLSGAAFWAALQVAVGNTFTKYNRGTMFWAMNSKTYALLKSKAITFTATGDVVANVYGVLPIVTGDIDILEFMPDGDIVGGYGDLYLWAQRSGMTIGMDDVGYTNRVQDQTLFFGKERADGMPVIAGAFVAINIAGSTPTKIMTFAGDVANTVSGILLPSAATVAGTGSIQLNAVLQPFGVEGTITWESATTSKATVSNTGLVTGVSSGSSVISATCNGYTANCTVTVT